MQPGSASAASVLRAHSSPGMAETIGQSLVLLEGADHALTMPLDAYRPLDTSCRGMGGLIPARRQRSPATLDEASMAARPAVGRPPAGMPETNA